MAEIVESINCPKCGGPLNLSVGEVIVTCPYCGTASRMRGDKPFVLRHGMLAARVDRREAESIIAGWMAGGFLKPDDLAKASRFESLECVYVPFYVFDVDASTPYVGVLTRTGTHERREGTLVRDYFWKVLGRRSGEFPVREYKLPLQHYVPFETADMVRDARFLNAEIDEDEALVLAWQQVDAHMRELLKDLVDEVEHADTSMVTGETQFLHAPIWFGRYTYRDAHFDIVVDAASGQVIRGEIPPPSGGLSEFFRGAARGMFRP